MASKDINQNMRENYLFQDTRNPNPYYNLIETQSAHPISLFNQSNQQTYLQMTSQPKIVMKNTTKNKMFSNLIQPSDCENSSIIHQNYQYPGNDNTLDSIFTNMTYSNPYGMPNKAAFNERLNRENNHNSIIPSLGKSPFDSHLDLQYKSDNKSLSSTTDKLENLQKQISKLKHCNDLQTKTLSLLSNTIKSLSEQVTQHREINEEAKKKICNNNIKTFSSQNVTNFNQLTFQDSPYPSNHNMPYLSTMFNCPSYNPK